MPPIEFILERSNGEAYQPRTERMFTSEAEIDPEKCPKGWTPRDVWRAKLTMERARG